MQTFLTFPDLQKSIESLDNKRLGKQRVEAMQLINILEGKQASAGWKNHPACKMWIGYTNALKHYCNICIDEWIKRGFKNTMKKYDIIMPIEYPWWFDNEDFHRAMRARLIAKDRDHYLPKFPNDENFNDSKYFWPVMETKTFRII